MHEADREERFHVIYGANYPRILGYVLRRARSPDDAADVVAETFLTAWRRLDDAPPGIEARLWLYGIARRVLANHHRGERRRYRLAQRLRQDLSGIVEASWSPASWEVEAMNQALDRLREQDREIVRLAAWEGLSHEELGKVLGCSRNAAKIRLHRARKRLAELARAGIAAKPAGDTGHTEVRGVPAWPAIEENR